MQKLHRPILTLHPDRLDITSAWIGHLPFAFWVIDAVKPNSLVELGTHGGVSYCAFCQAITHLKLPTTAHAIDTWDGDSHTGDYPSETYVELKAYHDPRYAAFSELVRTTFDNAAGKFAEGSIDLLHIDGLHTYEAVKHDFETWLPKLSSRAVVLFHDINVYERDFGVQTFWREVSQRYPSFAFQHGHGLGVLAVGEEQGKPVSWLTSLSEDNTRVVRETFADLARPLHSHAKLAAEVSGLREELGRIDGLRHSATEQNHQLNALRNELERDVLGLGEENARNADALEQTRDALTRAKQELTQLSQHAQNLQTDLDRVYRSTSWQVTGPIRWLGSGKARLNQSSSSVGALYRGLRAPGGVRRAVSAVRQRGLVGSVKRLRAQAAAARSSALKLAGGDDYSDWVARYDTLDADDIRQIKTHIKTFDYQPLISIVMPVYNTDPRFLEQCIESVLAQAYENWELCVADDASPNPEPSALLARYAKKDKRIRPLYRESQGGISVCTNSALDQAQGEFVALLDHDDLLPAHALYMVVHALNESPDLDLIYSDEDKIDEFGARFDPHFKTDFNYELLLGQNCISHLGVYRTSLIRGLGGLRDGLDGSQDHDLALRTVAGSTPKKIRHLPHVLYHWRVFSDSGSFSTDHLDRSIAAGVQAVGDHLSSVPGASVEPAQVGGFLRVSWSLPEPVPCVTVIVPTRDNTALFRECIDGLLNKTDYTGLQIIVVDNGSQDPQMLALLDELRREADVRVLRYDQPFNYSAINNFAVEHASTDYLCLLNDDIQIIEEGWLQEMVALAVRDQIGAVGARLLYGDGSVQHGGVVLGVQGVANHLHKHFPVDHPGYFGRLQLVQEVSAVTAACLVIKRSLYNHVGGLDEDNLSVAFNDVDFCLRLREAGYRNLWTPGATLYHMESASRGSDMDADKFRRFEKEVHFMQERWGEALVNDPFYNPNLSLDVIDMSLATPPTTHKPWRTA